VSISHALDWRGIFCGAILLAASNAFALDPHKGLTQYSRTTWTQQQELPQDTVRAIVQTADGYLWVGTDEGLARFDGYDFTTFRKDSGDLPSNSITALAATPDGALWIGTPNGLTQYREKRFHTYTTKSGLPDDAITWLYPDHGGALWIVAGEYLSRFADGRFSNFAPGPDLPVAAVRLVCEDANHDLWVAGYAGVGKLAGGKFTMAIDSAGLAGLIGTSMAVDARGTLWLAGNQGLLRRLPNGRIRKYGTADGLPDLRLRTVLPDRDGGIWVGSDSGLARLEGDRFIVTPAEGVHERTQVRCLFEDREGDLWVGTSTGLIRLRDDVFTVYGKSEGLPSDQPTVVFQDRAGKVWVGFGDSGLLQFSNEGGPQFSVREGLPGEQVFSIRQARNGDLLIGVHGGVARMHGERFSAFTPRDPFSRVNVYDAMEDAAGDVWLATPGGLIRMHGEHVETVIPGGPVLVMGVSTLCEARDGAIWAGTFGKGLWRIRGAEQRLYTTADGLSSDRIRTLYEDGAGALWIGTFDGGLDELRDGRMRSFTERDGLLSDNIARITDDGESLWLSTTRGICRVAKRQLRDLAAGKRRSLDPTNYGVEDGLRSAQCAPANPTAAGGVRTSDGELWFTTSRGLAIFDPGTQPQPRLAPAPYLVEMRANGEPVDVERAAKLPPESQRVEFRYTALHLSAPEQVQYSYKLEGVDPEWVPAGSRRTTNYNSLRHGHYRFLVRASLAGGPAAERPYDFEVLPHFYDTAWFRVLAVALAVAAAWGLYGLRLRQIRLRFALVLEERARLAREIHDTLAQGFVGISSQLDAVAMCLTDEASAARKYLDMARKMARHSLTEARRSVMDLRSSALEGQDLASALESGARAWTAGGGVAVTVDADGEAGDLPQAMEQHLLRIAQEAVTNVLKHAGATKIAIRLHTAERKLRLRIEDNGRGFEQQDVFSSLGGHFGLLGMRERAERLGGELRLESRPGVGTEVEVTVPLP
jgi:signal transduction histidine kinase/ligand-binding sensor domain-containing protein